MLPVHEREKGENGVVKHRLRPRAGTLSKLLIGFDLKNKEAVLSITDPIAREASLHIPNDLKTEFIQNLRAALDEWEKI